MVAVILVTLSEQSLYFLCKGVDLSLNQAKDHIQSNQGYYLPYILVGIAALLSGTTAIFGKYAYQANTVNGETLLSSTLLLSIRMSMSALLYFVLLVFKNKKAFKVNIPLLFNFAIAAFLSYVLTGTLFFESIKIFSPSIASTLLFTNVIFIAIFEVIIFRRPLKKTDLLIVVIVVLGSSATVLESLEGIQQFNLKGFILAISSALVYSLYVVLVSRNLQIDQSQESIFKNAFYINLMAALILNLRSPFYEVFNLPGAREALIGAAGLAIFATFITGLCYYYAIQKVGMLYSTLMFSLEPLGTVFFAYIFLKERLNWWQYSGIALILIGITIMNINNKKVKKE